MDFGSSQFLIQTHQVTLHARGRKPSDREQWASTSKATRANPFGCLFRRFGPGMIFTFLRSRFLSLPSPRQNPNVTSIKSFVLTRDGVLPSKSFGRPYGLMRERITWTSLS